MMAVVDVTIAQKAGENDQLFGSVTSKDIAEALEKQGYTIDRRKVQLDEPIKTLGDYKVTVRLHRDVTVEIPVHVDQGRIVRATGPGGQSADELLRSRRRAAVSASTAAFIQAIRRSGRAEEAAAGGPRVSPVRRKIKIRINLDPLLIDLFRHFGHRGSARFLRRRDPARSRRRRRQLIQALLPFGEQRRRTAAPLYEELGEEQGSDIAFLLAGLRVRDPRVLALLLDRLEYDAADGAFCLGLYRRSRRPAGARNDAGGDSRSKKPNCAARSHTRWSSWTAPEPTYRAEPFDIFAEYPERELPAFEVLGRGGADRNARFRRCGRPRRRGAQFFNQDLRSQGCATLCSHWHSRSRREGSRASWASLARRRDENLRAIRDAMIAMLNDDVTKHRRARRRGGRSVRGGRSGRRTQGLEALYEEGGKARVKALEAMWRSLWQPYARFFRAASGR